MNKEKRLKLIHHYIANIAVGPSTLRNHVPGVVDAARNFLAMLDLNKLKKKSVREYRKWLDKKTEKMMKTFPDGAKDDWGGARKVLNVFMKEAYFNKELESECNLFRLRDVLETPLDSIAAKRIRKYGKQKGIEWACKLCSEDDRESCNKRKLRCRKSAFPGIKNLKSYQSSGYQNVATEFALDMDLPRAEIDIILWGATDEEWENILKRIA